MVHAALDYAEPGDVIVVDTAGAVTNAILGDMATKKARARGLAGFVVDGLVRDVEGMIEAAVPVCARGVTSPRLLHRGSVELNYAISCGGISIDPGDGVIAGADGVVVVPASAAPQLVAHGCQIE